MHNPDLNGGSSLTNKRYPLAPVVRPVSSVSAFIAGSYDYEVDGERRTGRFNTRDLLSLRTLDKGDPLHVFYDANSPGHSMALLPSELESNDE